MYSQTHMPSFTLDDIRKAQDIHTYKEMSKMIVSLPSDSQAKDAHGKVKAKVDLLHCTFGQNTEVESIISL